MNKNDYNPNHVPEDVFARVGVKGVIYNENKNILLLKRSMKSSQGGKWSLPGGSVDLCENPSDAVVREIKEETQLEVSNIKPYITNGYLNEKNGFVVMIGFECQSNTADIALNWEHDEYVWASKEDVLKMDLSEHARFFVESLTS